MLSIVNRQEDKLPAPILELVEYLLYGGGGTCGQPALRLLDERLARDWLELILIDSHARQHYTEELRRRYEGEFSQPRPRREWPVQGGVAELRTNSMFRHHDLLPEKRAESVASGGVNVLTTDELAR